MNRTLGVVGAIALALCEVGCGGRVAVPARAEPVHARVRVVFSAVDTAPRDETNWEIRRKAAEDLQARLLIDLPRLGLGRPVQGSEASADVVLNGSFQQGSRGVTELSWLLTDARGGAPIHAGLYSEYLTGNIGGFADAVLAELATLDIDARVDSVAAAPAPRPARGVPDAPSATTDGSKDWVVAVGIEDYREALPPASHAVADARAFADYAQHTLGVPRKQIRVLTGQKAGLADLTSALKEWLPRHASGTGGRIYFFFSGHGAPDPETGETYLVPWDADPAYLKTRGLSVQSLYAQLDAMGGKQPVVFLDACFSGGGERSVIAQGTRPLVPVRAVESRHVIALTAAGARETTGAARDAKHGLFTRHLLAGLAGAADADTDGNISLAELGRHVRRRVASDARLDNRTQTPSLLVSDPIDAAQVFMVRGLK